MSKSKKLFTAKEGSFLEVFKYKDLLRELVVRDIKLKYRRSILGYVWSILNPLLIMIIMSVVFSFLFQRGIENFPIYLLCGRAMFEFVNQSSTKAMSAITDNTSLLKKTYVSKFMFPMAKITASFVDFLFSLGALVIVMLFFSIVKGQLMFSFWNLGFILVVFEAYIFGMGLGFLLAQLNVFFRDIKYIYNAFMTMWIYCSAIFYDVGMFYEKAAKQVAAGGRPYAEYLAKIIEYFNPLYIYIKQFRFFLWEPAVNTGYPWAQVSALDFVLGFGYAFLMFAIGTFFFKKSQDKFILYI